MRADSVVKIAALSAAPVALASARLAAPQLPRACLISALGPDWELRARALDAVAIHTNHQHLGPQMARAVKET
ncbi:hypothetical protein LTR94_038463, partial [Friedmanniomyces endolithicus]